MSSMVRASVPTSAAPPGGIEAEKSPLPRRVAAAVSARTGPATSSPSTTPANTASAASSSAVTSSLLSRWPARVVHRAGGQQCLDERDRLAAGGEHRHRGGVGVLGVDALHRRVRRRRARPSTAA